jgi:hypothetical protein
VPAGGAVFIGEMIFHPRSVMNPAQVRDARTEKLAYRPRISASQKIQ